MTAMRPPLFMPLFHERQPILANRSDSPLRLMGTLIVALLAITMAIFPISMPRAAASAGHQHAVVAGAGHEHVHDHATVDRAHDHADAASHADVVSSASGDHDQDSHDCTGPVCCSMGTCHAFQDTAFPILSSPAVSHLPVAMPGDEQVGGITTGSLDKPPRTV
jgi:ABC-type nickel/cobalt efflux system permease component RcnA